MTGTLDRPLITARLVPGQLGQRKTQATVLKLTKVLNILNHSDGQGACALLHPNSARGTRFSDTRVANHVTIGANWNRGTPGYLKAHRALDLVTKLLHKVLIPPGHLLQLIAEAITIILLSLLSSSNTVLRPIKSGGAGKWLRNI